MTYGFGYGQRRKPAGGGGSPPVPTSFDFDLGNKKGAIINGTFIETDRMLPSQSRFMVGIGANREYPLNFSATRGYGIASWNGTSWDMAYSAPTLTDRMYGCRLRESDGVVFSTLYNGGICSWENLLAYSGGAISPTTISGVGNFQATEVAEDGLIHFQGTALRAESYTASTFVNQATSGTNGIGIFEMIPSYPNDFCVILNGNTIATRRYSGGAYTSVGSTLALGNTYRGGFVYGQYAFIAVDFTGFRVYKWNGSAWSLLTVLTQPFTSSDRFFGMTGGLYPDSNLIWVAGATQKATAVSEADIGIALMKFDLDTETFSYIKGASNDTFYGAGTNGIWALQPQRRNENDPLDMGCYIYSRNSTGDGSMFCEFDVIPVF